MPLRARPSFSRPGLLSLFTTCESVVGLRSAAALLIGVTATGSFAADGSLVAKVATDTVGSRASGALTSSGDFLIGTRAPRVAAPATLLRLANGTTSSPFSASDDIDATVAVGPQDIVYVGSWDGRFFALGSTGVAQWTYPVGAFISSSAAIGLDGSLYFGAGDGALHAVTSTGAAKWTFKTGDWVESSPALTSSGHLLVFGSWDGFLYGLKTDGSLQWKTSLGSPVVSSPALDRDQTAIVASRDGRIAAIDLSNGTVRWQTEAGEPIEASPVLGEGGRLFIGTTRGSGLLLDTTTGAVLARASLGGSVFGAAVARADGSYVVGAGTQLMAVDREGRTLWSYDAGAQIEGSPTLSSTGELLFVAFDGTLHRVQSASGLAATSWPTYRGDSRRRGVAQTVAPASLPPTPTPTPSGPASPAPSPTPTPAVTAPPTANPAPTATPSPSPVPSGPGVTPAPTVSPTPTALPTPSLSPSTTPAPTAPTPAGGSGNPSVSPTPTPSRTVTPTPTPTPTTRPGSGTATPTPTASPSPKPTSPPASPPAPAIDSGPSSARLVNLSMRTQYRNGQQPIVGIAAQGDTTLPVLVRAVGPTLVQFGVSNALIDPVLHVFDGSTAVTSNQSWGANPLTGNLAASVGAFALPDGSRDAAVALPLEAKSYTFLLGSDANREGVALLEVYAANRSGSSRLVNLSGRAYVSPGDGVLIIGFVLSGPGEKRLLIRGIGPRLRDFGLNDVLEDPVLTLFRGDSILGTNDNWYEGADMTQTALTMASVGAFPLTFGAKDAALIVRLTEGAYTVAITGRNAGLGTALAEVYEIPDPAEPAPEVKVGAK